MWQFTLDDVPALSRSAMLLGTGGGGGTGTELVDPILRRALREHGPVQVVRPDELPPDSRAVPVGFVGSGTVMHEKPYEGSEIHRAVRGVEQHTGMTVQAVTGVAMTGIMAVVPVIAAAQLGLPLVDADGTGRGVTKLSHTTLTLAGIDLTPAAFTADKGSNLLVDGVNSADAENVIRLSMPAMGGWAGMAWRPLSMTEIAEAMLVGAYSRAVEMGRLFQDRDRSALAESYGARSLFEGKVVEVPRRHLGKSTTGTVVIEHSEQPDRALRVEMQNEYLVALEDGRIKACVPDLICVLEQETGRCLTAEQVRYGLWVEVLAIPCDPKWRSTAGLELLGPRAFGYDMDYVPLEETAP